MSKRANRNVLTTAGRLLAADTTRAIIAAPGAGLRLRIFKIYGSILTVAAQAIELGHDGGGVGKQVLTIPASYAGGPVDFNSDEGFVLDANTAFSAKPALAGPALQVYVEYTIEPA